jgi:hypothetical protein
MMKGSSLVCFGDGTAFHALQPEPPDPATPTTEAANSEQAFMPFSIERTLIRGPDRELSKGQGEDGTGTGMDKIGPRGLMGLFRYRPGRIHLTQRLLLSDFVPGSVPPHVVSSCH